MRDVIVKTGLLALLTCQNAGQTLVIKAAQAQGSHPDSVVVTLVAEIVKCLASLILFLAFEADRHWLQHFSPAAGRRSMKLVPIAALFAMQNQLLFVGVHNLDPPAFQALNQLKIITAGVFSVILLRKPLSATQWVALAMLASGAALVQMEGSLCASSAAASGELSTAKGFQAVCASAMLSGMAGCYTELMLKTEKIPIWIQSATVAAASSAILSATLLMRVYASDEADDDLFRGFVPMTWAVVLLLSLGGLTVVAVLRYADNVLKGMSMVLALLLSGVMSMFLFGTEVGPVFCLAAITICGSVFVYQSAPASAMKMQVSGGLTPKNGSKEADDEGRGA